MCEVFNVCLWGVAIPTPPPFTRVRTAWPHDCLQDITIRRLEEVIAGFEVGAEDKLEEAAAARAQELQQVTDWRAGVGGSGAGVGRVRHEGFHHEKIENKPPFC